jgi:hypothetical protein
MPCIFGVYNVIHLQDDSKQLHETCISYSCRTCYNIFTLQHVLQRDLGNANTLYSVLDHITFYACFGVSGITHVHHKSSGLDTFTVNSF